MKATSTLLPSEAFLSHSSANRVFVERLCRELHRHGIRFWYSTRNIAGAQQWHDEIGAALSRCDWFVLVLSPESVKSKWVKHELLFALNDSRYERRIVPCVLKKCDSNRLSWTLSSFQSIDFSESFEQGVRDLLQVWSVGYKPHPAPPADAATVNKSRRPRKKTKRKESRS